MTARPTVQLWWTTRSTTWAHWIVRTKTPSGELRELNVGRRVLLERVARALAWAALAGALVRFALYEERADLLGREARRVYGLLVGW